MLVIDLGQRNMNRGVLKFQTTDTGWGKGGRKEKKGKKGKKESMD